MEDKTVDDYLDNAQEANLISKTGTNEINNLEHKKIRFDKDRMAIAISILSVVITVLLNWNQSVNNKIQYELSVLNLDPVFDINCLYIGDDGETEEVQNKLAKIRITNIGNTVYNVQIIPTLIVNEEVSTSLFYDEAGNTSTSYSDRYNKRIVHKYIHNYDERIIRGYESGNLVPNEFADLLFYHSLYLAEMENAIDTDLGFSPTVIDFLQLARYSHDFMLEKAGLVATNEGPWIFINDKTNYKHAFFTHGQTYTSSDNLQAIYEWYLYLKIEYAVKKSNGSFEKRVEYYEGRNREFYGVNEQEIKNEHYQEKDEYIEYEK